MFNKLKEKAGYVSIETVIIAGLMITLGVFAIGQLYSAGESVTADALTRVNSAMDLAPTTPAE